VKVCIADDHSAVRGALRELLRGDLEVADVVEAATGDEAVAAVRSGAADLVLMDVNMPGSDGVAATRRIREQDPRVRVVALTAARDSGSVAAMLAAGADSYLVKTATPAELRDSLRTILAGGVALAPEVLPVVVGGLAQRLRNERDRADALDALDRTKREFISLVSDQLRTPLTAISGYVKTLRAGWERVDEDIKLEFLERIDQQAYQLERRIEQILTVTRLQAEQAAGGTAFAFDAAVREVLDRLAERTAERAVTADLDAVEIIADRRGITEVILALVDNALTHTQGAVRVVLRATPGEAVLEVADDGPGVNPGGLAARLDEPFTPGDATDTREAGGMGLSLYIAARVVDNAGGRLEFESGPGGTVACVRLPRTGLV
jgi:signal transduction histidine kinase